jgi:hypothetical protein
MIYESFWMIYFCFRWSLSYAKNNKQDSNASIGQTPNPDNNLYIIFPSLFHRALKPFFCASMAYNFPHYTFTGTMGGGVVGSNDFKI